MKYYFSAQTKGFYIEGLHKTMPSDVLEISEDKYKSLLAEVSSGKELYVSGGKVLSRAFVITLTWDDIRSTRDSLLATSDWTQLSDANLTDEQKTAWVTYRQHLRDITTEYASPDAVVWPTKPK